jgi:hypothetical protein
LSDGVAGNAELVDWHVDLMRPEAVVDSAVSRHPVTTPWAEIERVLALGGTFLTQQVGTGSNRELIDS